MWVLFETCLIILCVFCGSYDLPQSDVADFNDEIDYGRTAQVHCRSNDENHNFMFWEFGNDIVIGPGNKYNRSKYEYEVLSGILYIKIVSMEDAGLYRCISRGIRKGDWYVKTIRIFIKKDWEETWEHNHIANLFRIIIVIASFFILTGGTYLCYIYWKQKRVHQLNYSAEESENDSSDELFLVIPGPSEANFQKNHSSEEVDDAILDEEDADSPLIKIN